MHRQRLAAHVLQQAEELRQIVARVQTAAAQPLQDDSPGPLPGPHLEALRRDHMLPPARIARPHFAPDPDTLAAVRTPQTRAEAHLYEVAIKMIEALAPRPRHLARCHVQPRRAQRLREEANPVRKRENAPSARSPASQRRLHASRPICHARRI